MPNYVEPFAGSLAVLLGRPTEPRIETVNDVDAYLSCFWRAVQAAPEEVARWADWPVNEADLHARHRWLVGSGTRKWDRQRRIFRARMKRDPFYFDARIAGWWVWGLCQWIGSGWCAAPDWWASAKEGTDFGAGRRPALKGDQGIRSKGNSQSLANSHEWARFNAGRRSRGLNTADHATRPDLTAARGVHAAEKRPQLHHRGGIGVHSSTIAGGSASTSKRARNLSNASNWAKRPALGKGSRGMNISEQVPLLRGAAGAAGAAGAGIHASAMADKLPKMDRGTLSRMQPEVGEQIPDLGGNGGAAGKGITASAKTSDAILDWMHRLQARLRRVRVCCGDWKRVLGRSPTECIGVTGIFLDPPYGDEARDPRIYSNDSMTIAAEVAQWAREHGDNPKLRIALCGYEGEHEMPASWQCIAWKANGGYASSAGNHENARRECIWFSPACNPIVAAQGSLFAARAP